jgi:hypothetical protein
MQSRAARSTCFLAIAIAATLSSGGCAYLESVGRLNPLRVLAPPGTVIGRIRLDGGDAPAVLGPAVVYLTHPGKVEPVSARTRTFHYRATGPDSAFFAVATGESLRLVSEDGIHHRLFALASSGRVAIALPPRRAASPVRLPGPGLLRFYCDLHADESFLVYVAPSPWFSTVDRSGRYRIPDVTRGNWRLSIWSPSVAGFVREVLVSGGVTEQTVWLDRRRRADR